MLTKDPELGLWTKEEISSGDYILWLTKGFENPIKLKYEIRISIKDLGNSIDPYVQIGDAIETLKELNKEEINV